MSTTQQLSEHINQVYFGGNWTTTNLKEVLRDISWKEASIKIHDCNTIVMLVYHINYYVHEVNKVLEGKPLVANDSLAFNAPKISSDEDWQNFQEQVWEDGKTFSQTIEKLPDSILTSYFTDKKYGSYFRNLLGIIEHSHYHLGQIVIIKKLIRLK